MSDHEISEEQSYWFSDFQISCLQRVAELARPLGISMSVAPRLSIDEVMHGHKNEVYYLVIWFPDLGLECWVYETDVMYANKQNENYYFEKEEYLSEAERIEKFAKSIKSELVIT